MNLNNKSFNLQAPLTILVCLLLFAASLLFSEASNSMDSAGVVECQACHENLVQNFFGSIHEREGFSSTPVQSCETCHGPGQDHIEEGSDPSKIYSFSHGMKSKGEEVCLKCHERGVTMHFAGSIHAVRDISCTDCHRIHAPEPTNSLLKADDEMTLCLSCHTRTRSAVMKSSHHPMREGKMNCSDCHNPHGTLTDSLIAGDTINEVCYQCHAEKRGPVLWDHISVREDCVNCHDPHGSNHQRLLKARVPYLCQRCHSETRHPGKLYDQSNLSTPEIYNRGCLNCHAAIHGSSHPSGRTFLR